MIPEIKICGICGLEKTKDNFQIRKKPNGYCWLRRECKKCQEELRRRRYHTNPDVRKRVLENSKIYAQKNKEKLRAYYKKYDEERKEKVAERGKIDYINNKEKIKEQRREYYKKNRDRQIESVCNYIKTNLSAVRQRQRKRYAVRINEDLSYKLLKRLRTRVASAIKINGVKCKKTSELVGCSMDFLRQHLESLFLPGMNWDNYGIRGWHIDHIIPCDAFDFTNPEDQKKCFHYTNLQPLWWLDNIKKSNKVA